MITMMIITIRMTIIIEKTCQQNLGENAQGFFILPVFLPAFRVFLDILKQHFI